MSRPLVWLTVGYAVGSCLAMCSVWLSAAAMGIAVIIWIFFRSQLPWKGWLALFLMLCLSLWNVSEKTKMTYAAWPPVETGCVTGRISRISEFEYSEMVLIKEARAVIRMPKGSTETLFCGQMITVNGKAQPFQTAGNPGEFDSEKYYRSMGYVGQLEAKTWEAEEPDTWLEGYLQTLHQVRRRVENVLSEYAQEDAGILQAVLLGEKELLEEEIQVLYQEAGAAHLLSVSGLHISILCMGLYRWLRKGHVPVQLALLIGSLVCGSYVWMSGASVSAQRAGIMFLVHMTAVLLGRTYDLPNAVSLAALLILLDNPLYLGQSGFQLSFTAVVILAWQQTRSRGVGMYRNNLQSGVILYLGMAPFLAWHFGQVSPLSVFANLVLIPLAPILFYCGILGCLCGGFKMHNLAALLFSVVHGILKGYEWICKAVVKIPFGVLSTGQPCWWQIALYGGVCAGFLWLVQNCLGAHSTWRKRMTAGMENGIRSVFVLAGLCLPLVLCRFPVLGLQIVMLDVGQGECIVTHFPNGEWMMTDAGSTDLQDVWEKRINPYLTVQGIRKMNYVLVTHSDSDHCNGVIDMLEDGFPVECLLISGAAQGERVDALRKAAAENGTEVRAVKEGDTWNVGKTVLTVLWPKQPDTESGEAENNDTENVNGTSIVYRLSYGEFSMLFTGDLPGEEEMQLYEQGVLRQEVVLKVGHHGSHTSTEPEFLDAVDPLVSVISCGANNIYGHPHEEVLACLEKIGSRIYITAEDGAITMKIRGRKMGIKTFRN